MSGGMTMVNVRFTCAEESKALIGATGEQ